ncbi:MAG: hypothetical protein LBM75_05080 [Myxococcales bacterium]|jgi:hypothetical protein|nr:hypothetical protein [Myxococcales bacterium]
MKKSLLLALFGALMMVALPACSDDVIVVQADAGEDDIDVPNILDPGVYTLRYYGQNPVRLGHDTSYDLAFEFVDENNTPKADVNIRLNLSMNESDAASFASASNRPTWVAVTDADGYASATVYGLKKNGTGTILVTVQTEAGAEVNSLSIPIVVEGGAIVENTGNVSVVVNNSTTATKASIYINEIGSSSYPSCEQFMGGVFLPTSMNTTNSTSKNNIGSSVNHTFSNLTAGNKVIVYVEGMDGGNNVLALGCQESTTTVSASAPIDVVVTLEALPVNYDQNYDVLLGLHLSEIIPAQWQQWFGLVDGLFRSPIGTAVYYIVKYIPSFNISTYEIDLFDMIVGGMTLTEVLDACDAGQCPVLRTGVTIPILGDLDSILATFGVNFSVYQLIMDQAEAYIDANVPYYDQIKTVGSDIVAMAKDFDIGARFELTEDASGNLNIHETWTHIVWTWKLNEACRNNSADLTCGRHAFNIAEVGNFIVDLDYTGVISGDRDIVTVTLPQDHSFPLKYGALVKMLVNKVVVPQVMGSSYTSGAGLDGLIDYWIKCDNLGSNIDTWLDAQGEPMHTIGGFITAAQLASYCRQGLKAGVDAAMNQLTGLEANVNLIVPTDSYFKLTDLDASSLEYSRLYDLKYNVSWNGETSTGQTFGAGITGEGAIAEEPSDCESFLLLTPAAAQAACGN